MHLLFVIYKMVPLQTGLVQVEMERERHGTRRSIGYRVQKKVRRAESEDERIVRKMEKYKRRNVKRRKKEGRRKKEREQSSGESGNRINWRVEGRDG